MKNRLLRKCVRLLRSLIPSHPTTGARRILVVATTALGDTLWATPALESLRASFPSAYLAALTSPIGEQVLKHNPWTDRVYLLKKSLLSRFFSLWRKLYRDRFDTILLLHASQRLVLPLCALLGAREIAGTKGLQKGLDDLLTTPLPPLFEHEIERRLKLVERIGGKATARLPTLHLRPEERQGIALPEPGQWVALHPGSKDRFKRWPAAYFGQVGRALQETYSCKILLTGTSDERPLMEEIAAQIPGAHLAAKGLSLRSLAALLEQVDLLISNDTGPVHLACALGRPVIALYAATDPRLCGPRSQQKTTALAKRPTCEPCLKKQCRAPFCLLQIPPREVLEAAAEFLTPSESSKEVL